MSAKTTLLLLGIMMLLELSACAKGPNAGKEPEAAKTKVVWIAKDGNVSRTYEASNATLEQRLPEPGDIVLFRTTEALGTLGNGRAGEAYELDSANKLRKIGEFDLTRTDAELVTEYQKK